METTTKGIGIIIEKIREYDNIIIFGHIRPDGDCLGSQFGLKDIIKTTWPSKHVYVSGQNSAYLSFLGTTDRVPEFLYKESLGIVVDSGSTDRISDPLYKECKELIKIDHHNPVGTYGDYVWVEEEWPSTAQMIGYLYKAFENQLSITKKGAEALYTGIVTDTGGFKYRGVTKLTHNIAGMLLDKGAEVDKIDLALSITKENILALKGYVLTNLVKTDYGFIYSIITQDIIDRFEVSYEDAASMVNQMAGVEGYPVWALIIEYPTEYRVRMRSLSTGPKIHKIAEAFGGGGHDNAAGFSINNLDGGVADVEFAVKRTLEEFNRNKDSSRNSWY